jgi:hypothetical protein
MGGQKKSRVNSVNSLENREFDRVNSRVHNKRERVRKEAKIRFQVRNWLPLSATIFAPNDE